MSDSSKIPKIYNMYAKTNDLTEKQRKIFAAAIKLFSEKGYSNTSTNEIAQEAGVSEGSIYKKFKNKRGLLDAIINPVVRSILPETLEMLSEKKINKDYNNLNEFIDNVVNDRLRFIKENIDVFRIYINEMLYDSDLREKTIEQIPDKVIQNFDSEVDKMKERGLMVDWSNNEIFRYIFFAIFGYVFEHYILHPKEEWDEKNEIDHLVRFISQGLTP